MYLSDCICYKINTSKININLIIMKEKKLKFKNNFAAYMHNLTYIPYISENSISTFSSIEFISKFS